MNSFFKKWRTFLEGPLGSMLPDIGLLFARLGFGLTMMIAHGYGKMASFPNPQFPDPLGVGATLSHGLAAFAEFVCAGLLVLGLGTRLALTQLIATMGAAFFLFHSADPFLKKELSFIYLIGCVTLFITGPGRLSVDAWLIGTCVCKNKRQLD
jgi:putative oxidoreductase